MLVLKTNQPWLHQRVAAFREARRAEPQRYGRGVAQQSQTKEIAKLAGLAPLARDSGKRTGTRCGWGGRAPVRAVLCMAAVVAKRYNPVIREFYERLLAKGKPKKVALTACMRKLVQPHAAPAQLCRRTKVWAALRRLHPVVSPVSR